MRSGPLAACAFAVCLLGSVWWDGANGGGAAMTSEGTMTIGGKTRVYVAGPYGFAPSTERFMREHYYRAVAEAGCEVVDPWRRTMPPHPSRDDLMTIGRANATDLDASDGIVAALDGPDVDSGTAAEIGYAAARGKWIIGYRGDFRRSGESPEVTVNLQVEYFIRRSGGDVVRSLEDLTAAVRRLSRQHRAGGQP